MGTQKETTKYVVDDDGDFVLALKNNHPTLRKQVEQTFASALVDTLQEIQVLLKVLGFQN